MMFPRPEGAAEADPAAEPDWEALIPFTEQEDGLSSTEARSAASGYWQSVTAAMREQGTFGPENRHQVQRLALAYVRYDHASAEIARGGAITRAPRTKVQMLSVWLTVAKHASDEASTLEAELGLTPRRRGAVTKIPGKKRAARASDVYMRTGAAAGPRDRVGH